MQATPTAESGILQPERNVWCVEPARRAAMLVDAAPYFIALRRAMLKARHSIVIAGWDIDSRTPLVGPDGETGDDLPATFGPFISELVRRRPELSVKLLLWDFYTAVYSLEREPMPLMALQWSTPAQVELCLDDVLPVGASHHQKVVVIDDALAFSGGLDITIRRWDDPQHRIDNPLRVDPAGKPYTPFHDVQMMVDGPAAAALGRLLRWRWYRATHEQLPPLPEDDSMPDGSDPWPDGIEPDFRDVGIGIARTAPHYGREPEVREVEALFLDMIGSADRLLYIENQFLTCTPMAEKIVGRLGERPDLEVLIVAPRTHYTWLEQQSMLAGRIRFMELIRRAGCEKRVRLVYPCIAEDGAEPQEVMVHSKVMAVDDRLLRIGSANLCNRSVAVDTECDLVAEAGSAESRARIAAARNRLIGEHCGTSADEIAAALERHGSLFAALDALPVQRQRLCPIADEMKPGMDVAAQIEAVADPSRPFRAENYLPDPSPEPPTQRRLGAAAIAAISVLAVIALVFAWQYTPLSEWASPDRLAGAFGAIASSAWAWPAVIGLYVLGGFVAFPVTLLIAATAITFGAWEGFFLALAGSMASAIATYAAGRQLGADLLRRLLGPRINRVTRRVKDNGILAVTTLRVMPTAPFMLVNLVAGAARIRVFDYTAGTLLGLLPGIAIMAALGGRMLDMIRSPSLADLAMIALFLLVWLGLSYAMQIVVVRIKSRIAARTSHARASHA